MKELSRFVKEEFLKNDLFEGGVFVTTLEEVDHMVSRVSAGECISITFRSSSLKDYFLDSLYGIRPDLNVVNCNCTVDRFNENTFDGLLIFNNVRKCGHLPIIEMVKKHKGVIICQR
jgi:hypothetical protein